MASQLQHIYEGKIDFFGQEVVESWSRVALSVCATLAFVVGFVMQSLRATFGVFGAGVLLIVVLAVPPWPYLNRFPVAWTDVKVEETKKKR
ncbi:hypothetical protein FRC14_003373 [Serendipita sp. 396]|nr:hypothetical protein FRC14_003373 [Serendipita sp. 396]KAG8784338.1 hypothetical protein FRC15_003412 [Serendipita sp. 397]KAG8799723.1 hypothetical protein FRC16_004510 [Serendipita sp. 398]KAG8826943.1 hypothetical protein FRC19_006567 [Serendipita sp. 401]KAG8858180.1 hypothetical protein FRB91_010181 [Serendipita sp. 411]KAG8868283.1 hypothetical protein FRC20_003674 [Serendipita sp. 405]KAG9057614.1 hypothetical protein FS842_005318 [Serendipita sp. 407]